MKKLIPRMALMVFSVMLLLNISLMFSGEGNSNDSLSIFGINLSLHSNTYALEQIPGPCSYSLNKYYWTCCAQGGNCCGPLC